MAYPEPIPPLKKKDWEKLMQKLENPPPLSAEQRAFYKRARERFVCQPDCIGHHEMGYCADCSRRSPEKRDKYKKY